MIRLRSALVHTDMTQGEVAVTRHRVAASGVMMQRASTRSEAGAVSEIAIVDTFTKLIFGEENYSDRELLIIRAFRSVDSSVLLETHRDMGSYLRVLGVREMIQLVALVQDQLLRGLDALPGSG